MKANIKYFGMIAEKIGKTDESVNLTSEDQSNIRTYFVNKYNALNKMNYQIAVNQTLTEEIDNNADFVEIALLPPFAGG